MYYLSLLLAIFVLQSSQPTSRPDEPTSGPSPAAFDDLRPPPWKREGVKPPPEDGFIGRNAGVADSLTEEGTDVAYTFLSRKGEVSLFQLSSWGFERGWQSTARLRVLDEAGFKLASRSRSGGGRYELFLAFEAPRDGTFRVELKAVKQSFRYTLARHSDFPANYGERIDLGRANRTFGFLADPAKRVTIQVQLEAGEEVSFKALNTDPIARDKYAEARAALATAGDSSSAAGPAMRGATDNAHQQDWPHLAVRVLGQPQVREGSPHYFSFVPEASGKYFVEVFSKSRGEGGFFQFEVQRAVQRHRVQGHVADRETRARDRVTLRFYREPDFELVASATTDADGNYQTQVPSGPYLITMQGEGLTLSSFRTNVLGPREINTIYSTNAAPR